MKKKVLFLLCFATQIALYSQSVNDSIYLSPSINAFFTGGDSLCSDYIVSHLVMPEDALKMNAEGVVTVQFVVEKEGQLSSVEISRGMSMSVNNEIIRVVKAMPAWNSAKVNDKPVRSKVEIPVEIRQYNYLSFDSLLVYLDSNFKLVDQAKATHYRVVKKGDHHFIAKYYLKDGTLVEEYQCRTANPLIKHGNGCLYHANGKVKTFGFYANYMRQGTFNSYNEMGELESKENYKNNKLDGLCTYYKRISDSDFVEMTYHMDSLEKTDYKYYDFNGEVLNSLLIDSEFPGGELERQKYLTKNLRYPILAREKEVEGTVYVSFCVEKDGSISTIKLLKDIGFGCGKEGIRVVKEMPKWKVGSVNGTLVRTQFVLPIKFTLN